jgi:hypothetical protein
MDVEVVEVVDVLVVVVNVVEVDVVSVVDVLVVVTTVVDVLVVVFTVVDVVVVVVVRTVVEVVLWAAAPEPVSDQARASVRARKWGDMGVSRSHSRVLGSRNFCPLGRGTPHLRPPRGA